MGICFFGFAPLVAHWFLWYPLVVVLYIVPAASQYGIRMLLRIPVLAILTKGLGAQVAALFRTALLLVILFLFASAQLVQQGDGWQTVELLYMGIGTAFYTLMTKADSTWRLSQLNEFWMFLWVPRGVTAKWLVQVSIVVFACLLCLYWICLIFSILRGCAFRLRHRGEAPSPSVNQSREQSVRELLQRHPDEFRRVGDGSIRPMVPFTWPWRSTGLWQRVALVLFDVALDLNTIFAFMFARHYFFAVCMTFVVVQSLCKQLSVIKPWRLRQALVDYLVWAACRLCNLFSPEVGIRLTVPRI